ncbi:hypothetical protein FQN54_000568 [Arachnomyces sp. PD_36]|nr:hypothetical protein FQN54_000568 [Arachnomyces sp. PD_36]
MDGLRTIIMLTLYKTLSGDFKSVDILLSGCSRLIFTMGGHIWPPSELSYDRTPGASPLAFTPSIAQSHLRSLFWICYLTDKEMSLRTGRPPTINDNECDLTPGDEDIEQIPTESISGLASNDFCFLGEIRLSVIKSKTYNLLYSARAHRKTDAELLQIIRELDDDLEKWRVSLLPEYRPATSFSQEPPFRSDEELRAIILRLEYHRCMAIIHQASSRCRAWMENTSGVMEGVSSSLELAVQASRCSLFHLYQSRGILVKRCFWFIIFFPISSLMTIFCNILQNPLHPHRAKDLELLQQAPAIAQEVLLDQEHKHVRDIEHIKSVEELMILMGKLAKSAIEKATRESRHGSDSTRSLME